MSVCPGHEEVENSRTHVRLEPYSERARLKVTHVEKWDEDDTADGEGED